MRTLDVVEMKHVSGGLIGSSDPTQLLKGNDQIVKICNDNGYPDSAKVTLIHSSKGTISFAGNGTEATSGIQVTTTCGDAKAAAAAETSASYKGAYGF